MTIDAGPGSQAYSDAAATAANETCRKVTYLQLFEERLTRLRPFTESRSITEGEAGSKTVALYPGKFTAVVLFRNNQGEYEILLGKKSESGYQETDHVEIVDEFEKSVAYPNSYVFGGFLLVTADGKRHLMFQQTMAGKRRNAKELKVPLQKYDISTVLSEDANDDDISDWSRSVSEAEATVNEYRELFLDLIDSSTSIQIAQKLGLTGEQFLRFRLIGMLPE
jgi:hypothetical protein